MFTNCQGSKGKSAPLGVCLRQTTQNYGDSALKYFADMTSLPATFRQRAISIGVTCQLRRHSYSQNAEDNSGEKGVSFNKTAEEA
jgi:hypothetical protein